MELSTADDSLFYTDLVIGLQLNTSLRLKMYDSVVESMPGIHNRLCQSLILGVGVDSSKITFFLILFTYLCMPW